ncbi:hypothetical protein HN51_070194, partial [Arachis hypogaea]
KKKLDFVKKLYQQNLKNLRNLIVKVHCCMKVKRPSQFLFHPYLIQVNLIKKKKKRATGPLEKAFNVNARETLDLYIVKIFFSSRLLFHLAKNLYFVKAFSYAANNYIDSYIPPRYNKLRTTVLEKEKQCVERMLGPTKNSWSE